MALTDQNESTPRLSVKTVRIPSGIANDPLSWFPDKPSKDIYWFWEIPEEKTSWLGIGEAESVTLKGSTRFSLANKHFQKILDLIDWEAPDDAPPPRFAVGFSFDENSENSDWEFLGNSQLIFPRIQILRNGEDTWLTTTNASLEEAPLSPAPSPSQPTDTDPKKEVSEKDRDHYKNLVLTALKEIENGDLEKAVPCRSIFVERKPIIQNLLSSLRNSYPACATFCVYKDGNAFVGSTPERLASTTKNGKLYTAALAGSAPRASDQALDSALSQGLLTSPKEKKEHALVVEEILRRLVSLGLQPEETQEPTILKLNGIQHLYTPIHSQLNSEVPLLEAVDALHPTPAVSGHPLKRANELRLKYESFDRGWFAGPIGWLDISGAGEFRVALRSGLINKEGTTLFAGAGVVNGSDPGRELIETDMKLKAMLDHIVPLNDSENDQ